MTYFTYHGNIFHAESTSVIELEKKYGTPFYVYSMQGIIDSLSIYKECFSSIKHKVFYAVKACSNLSILKALSEQGSYFDVVSEGELYRVAAIDNGSLRKCIFSGVGKTRSSIIYAIKNDIHCINIESHSELALVAALSNELEKTVNIAFRINPNIDAKSHPYISTGLEENKFGINISDATKAYQQALSHKFICIKGVSCHIGSQIEDLSVFDESVSKVLAFYDSLKSIGINLEFIDIGGGLGISYDTDMPPKVEEYANRIISSLPSNLSPTLYLEPGRSIIGKNGILVTKVEFIKTNNEFNFAIVDSGMNDLLRPSLYKANHRVLPIKKPENLSDSNYHIVGPICETSDTFSKDFNNNIEQGDLIAILDCGAYGSSMASNYNTRPNIPEVLVYRDTDKLIRRRQTIESLIKDETICL